jgi:hypothetical protein
MLHIRIARLDICVSLSKSNLEIIVKMCLFEVLSSNPSPGKKKKKKGLQKKFSDLEASSDCLRGN